MDKGVGYLRVYVTSVGGSVPIEGARVAIYGYGNDGDDGALLYILKTDQGGYTNAAGLPAPPASESKKPGGIPYTLYNVAVNYSGYYPTENVGVPIYDGIYAVQPVDLLPIGEEEQIAGAEGGKVTINEMGGENL